MNKQYFEKLNTEKLAELKEVKLAKLEEIKLSLVSDAKAIVKEGKALDKKLISAFKPFAKIEAEYEKVVAKVLDFLDETKGMVQDGEELQKNANAMYDKLEKGAKDLGTDVTDIPVANELDEIAVNLEDSINDIRNARRQGEDLF